MDMKFRAKRRQLAANHPDATDQIIVVGETEAGRVLVDRAEDLIRIVDITVALGHRGNGVAHEVVAGLVDEADATGRHIEVTAWSGNAAAVTLVEHAGFAAVRDEAGYVTYRREPRASLIAVSCRDDAAASTSRPARGRASPRRRAPRRCA